VPRISTYNAFASAMNAREGTRTPKDFSTRS